MNDKDALRMLRYKDYKVLFPTKEEIKLQKIREINRSKTQKLQKLAIERDNKISIQEQELKKYYDKIKNYYGVK